MRTTINRKTVSVAGKTSRLKYNSKDVNPCYNLDFNLIGWVELYVLR